MHNGYSKRPGEVSILISAPGDGPGVPVGLESQRSYASNTLRGVSDDGREMIAPLAAWIRDAPSTVGLGA